MCHVTDLRRLCRVKFHSSSPQRHLFPNGKGLLLRVVPFAFVATFSWIKTMSTRVVTVKRAPLADPSCHRSSSSLQMWRVMKGSEQKDRLLIWILKYFIRNVTLSIQRWCRRSWWVRPCPTSSPQAASSCRATARDQDQQSANSSAL